MKLFSKVAKQKLINDTAKAVVVDENGNLPNTHNISDGVDPANFIIQRNTSGMKTWLIFAIICLIFSIISIVLALVDFFGSHEWSLAESLVAIPWMLFSYICFMCWLRDSSLSLRVENDVIYYENKFTKIVLPFSEIKEAGIKQTFYDELRIFSKNGTKISISQADTNYDVLLDILQKRIFQDGKNIISPSGVAETRTTKPLKIITVIIIILLGLFSLFIFFMYEFGDIISLYRA